MVSCDAHGRTDARANGNPDASIKAAQQDRLENWRRLQELAGLK